MNRLTNAYSIAYPAVIMVGSYQLSGLQVEEFFSNPGTGKGGVKGRGRGQSTTGPSSILDSNSKLGKQILFETTDVADIFTKLVSAFPSQDPGRMSRRMYELVGIATGFQFIINRPSFPVADPMTMINCRSLHHATYLDISMFSHPLGFFFNTTIVYINPIS